LRAAGGIGAVVLSSAAIKALGGAVAIGEAEARVFRGDQASLRSVDEELRVKLFGLKLAKGP
jgi:fructose-1,6-bisphosphatase/sedoheptulose 1,7-bisphosphatase-like protein